MTKLNKSLIVIASVLGVALFVVAMLPEKPSVKVFKVEDAPISVFQLEKEKVEEKIQETTNDEPIPTIAQAYKPGDENYSPSTVLTPTKTKVEEDVDKVWSYKRHRWRQIFRQIFR